MAELTQMSHANPVGAVATASQNTFDAEPALADRKPGMVEFMSKSLNYRLVFSPIYQTYDNQGRIIATEPEQAVEFSNGQYLCDPKAKFTDGTLILEWLRSHERIDNDFAGFFEVPLIAPPVTTADLEQVTQATFDRDVEALMGMWKAETEGWKRPELVGPLELALSAIAKAEEAAKPTKKGAGNG